MSNYPPGVTDDDPYFTDESEEDMDETTGEWDLLVSDEAGEFDWDMTQPGPDRE